MFFSFEELVCFPQIFFFLSPSQNKTKQAKTNNRKKKIEDPFKLFDWNTEIRRAFLFVLWRYVEGIWEANFTLLWPGQSQESPWKESSTSRRWLLPLISCAYVQMDPLFLMLMFSIQFIVLIYIYINNNAQIKFLCLT